MPKNNKTIQSAKKVKILRNIFVGFIIAVVIFIGLSLMPIPGIYKLYTVRSGSMEPSIRTGSLAVVKPSSEYFIDDVITFNLYENVDSITTHRIITTNGDTFTTKGDANATSDLQLVKKNEIIGKVIFDIPYLGYPIGYAKTLPGLIILIIIPSTIIIWEEIKKLKQEWLQAQRPEATGNKKIKAKKLALSRRMAKRKNLPIKSDNKLPANKIIAIFLSFVCLTSYSIQANYNDREISNSSMISGAWESNCLVINEVYYDVDPAHGLDGEDLNGQKGKGNQNNNPDEWVELYNNCNYDVSLKNWTITDNEAILNIHANKSIPANGYGLLSKSASTWTQYWGFGPGLGNLPSIQIIETGEDGPPIYQIMDNTGDKLILKNNSGEIIDQMNYGNNTHVWNPAVPGAPEGYSLSRNPLGYDTDLPPDFIPNCIPSPGQPNITICPSE